MGYPCCKKCKKDISNEIERSTDSAFHGLKVIYQCETCGLKCEATYNFEHVSPDNIFWEDD